MKQYDTMLDGPYTGLPKPFFTKWMPAEGEIKEGDTYLTPSGNIVKALGPCSFTAEWKKHKLFLCSRDIQVGDKYLTAPDYSKERICEDASYNFENCLKVIGEVSPEATWVKPHMEFDETELRFAMYKHFYDHYAFCNEGITKEEWLSWLPHNSWERCIQIKNQHCKHFH